MDERGRAGPERSERVETARAATDLALGAAACALAHRLGSAPEASCWWRASYWCAGAAALAGAAHHAVLTREPRMAHVSWRLIGLVLSLALSMLLVASALQVLGRRWTRRLAPLAAVGPAAYALAALRGGGGVDALVAVQAGTMAAVVATWIAAAARPHPAARAALGGIALSAGAAGLRPLVPRAWERWGADGDSVYHLAQIPGLVLLARAARMGAPAG